MRTLSELFDSSSRSPALGQLLPVFIKQKIAEFSSWPSYFIFPFRSPALREPLPVSLFAAEHAICRPGNFNPQQNTPASDKIGQNTVGTKSGNFAEISILSGFLFNLFTNEVP